MADAIPSNAAAPNSNPANGQLPTNEPTSNTPKFAAPDPAPAPAAKPADDSSRLLAEAREEAAAQKAAAKAAAKAAEDLQKRLDAIEAEKLAEQGKYKELYEKEVASRKQLEGRTRERAIRAEIRAAAAAEGLMDLDAADLISAKSIRINEETGDFEGIREAVAAHKEAKPHWYRAQPPVSAAPMPAPTTGNPSAPAPEPSKPIDVRTLSKEEYARKKQDWIRSLRGR